MLIRSVLQTKAKVKKNSERDTLGQSYEHRHDDIFAKKKQIFVSRLIEYYFHSKFIIRWQNSKIKKNNKNVQKEATE